MRYLSDKLSFAIALSLYAATLETLLPHPPFVRYGFAYIPLLIFASAFTLREFFVLLCFKCAISALFSLSFISPAFILSLFSTLASGVVIYSFALLKKKGKRWLPSHIGVSLISSFVANAVQLVLSYFFLFKDLSIFLSPLFVIVGLCSSLFVGIVANVYEDKANALFSKLELISYEGKAELEFRIKGKTLVYLALSFVIMALCILASSLISPQGEVLFSYGALRVGSISLYQALMKILIIFILFLISLISSLLIIKNSSFKKTKIWYYYFFLFNFYKGFQKK